MRSLEEIKAMNARYEQLSGFDGKPKIPQAARPIWHELKTWPEAWRAVADGRKRFEVRRDDRGFDVGDLLALKLWRPLSYPSGGTYLNDLGVPSRDGAHTAATIRAVVTHKFTGAGIEPGYCVLGIRVQEEKES